MNLTCYEHWQATMQQRGGRMPTSRADLFSMSFFQFILHLLGRKAHFMTQWSLCNISFSEVHFAWGSDCPSKHNLLSHTDPNSLFTTFLPLTAAALFFYLFWRNRITRQLTRLHVLTLTHAICSLDPFFFLQICSNAQVKPGLSILNRFLALLLASYTLPLWKQQLPW